MAGRHVLRHLEDGEGLLASVVGVEERQGFARRRLALVATDRRLLLVRLRPAPPVTIDYADLVAIEVDGDRVRVVTADGVHALQRVSDTTTLRLLADLVESRHSRQKSIPDPARIRLIS